MIRKSLFVFVLSLLLAACKSQLQSPESAPANFKVTAGDSQAVLSWDMAPGMIYTVYYQVGLDVSPGNYSGISTNARSPLTITGLANQTQYAFIVNASNDGSVPGPSTAVVTVTPGGSGGPGQAWTVGSPLLGPSQDLHGVAFGNLTFVAVGDGGALFTATVSSSSSSGIGAWNPVGTTLPGGLPSFCSVLYTGGSFLALTVDGHILASNNAVTWRAQTQVIPTGSGDGWTWLAYDGNNVVAVGLQGKIATNHSTTLDTAAWTVQTVFTGGNELDGVAYVNGKFIATGQGGALAVSSDGGASWNVVDLSTVNAGLSSKALYRATFAGGQYLVVGDAGTVLASPDAVNWAQEAAPTTQDLYSVAFNGAEVIAVGTSGTILQSPTGADGSWAATTGGTRALNDVTAGGALFVAVGNEGTTVSGN